MPSTSATLPLISIAVAVSSIRRHHQGGAGRGIVDVTDVDGDGDVRRHLAIVVFDGVGKAVATDEIGITGITEGAITVVGETAVARAAGDGGGTQDHRAIHIGHVATDIDRGGGLFDRRDHQGGAGGGIVDVTDVDGDGDVRRHLAIVIFDGVGKAVATDEIGIAGIAEGAITVVGEAAVARAAGDGGGTQDHSAIHIGHVATDIDRGGGLFNRRDHQGGAGRGIVDVTDVDGDGDVRRHLAIVVFDGVGKAVATDEIGITGIAEGAIAVVGQGCRCSDHR